MKQDYVTTEKGKSPFSDAVAVWHMGDLNDSAGNNSVLTIHGDVEVGIELSGAEREASLKRGGDGRAAVFRGGYLNAGQGVDGELNLTGKQMTMCIRLRSTTGKWNFPLFGKYGGDDKASYCLYCVDGNSKPFYGIAMGGREVPTPFRDMFSEEGGPRAIQGTRDILEFVWGTEPIQEIVDELIQQKCGDPLLDEARKGIMKVSFPVALMEPTDWHDIVVRFTGPKLEMFIDGVLVDEEFPIGSLRQNSDPCLICAAFQGGEVKAGFHGMVDHAALWDRALSDEEIVTLSGGQDEVDRQELEILGQEKDRMQYWRPRGYNSRAGDCIPFFHDGVYHLFYLVVRRNHHGKWQCGHGGLQIYHASTRDLVRWKHHPLALPITYQWESWLGTGAFAYHDGLYYTFQKVPCMLRELNYGGIQKATSVDCIHFTKEGPWPFIPGADCDIYQDKNTGLFHMLTARDQTDNERISIERFVSSDLESWEEAEEPFITTDARFRPNICPHLFEWNDWYYFMAGIGIWVSKDQFGPWTLHTPSRLDLLSVPKTAAFTGNRRILAGFLPDRGWGGNLVFRELVQHEDGTLGTRFPLEMIPSSGDLLNLPFKAMSESVSGDSKSVHVSAPDGFKTGMLTGVPQDVRISLDVKPVTGSSCFGLCVRGFGNYDKGCELLFEPSRERVQFGVPHNGRIDRESGYAIDHVKGLDRPFTLDVVVKDDIVDVSIDNRRTIATRYWDPRGDRLFFFAQNADVIFDSVRIQSLSE